VIRIGVIGAGNNGRGHARYYHECPRSEVIAIADPDTERATAVAEEVRAEAVSDHREFLDRVDAVVISSPNFLHRDHAVECAGAGKHIFCEKPMGLNVGQAREIADAVAAAGVRSLVGFSVHFTPPIQTMERYLREGRLGTLRSLWSRRLTYSDPNRGSGWRRDHSLSGGLLYEINIHELEWMMALGGEVESVYARTWASEQSRETSPRANDHIWFMLGLAGGPVASHEGSHVSPTAEYVRGVIGTEGGMITNRWGNEVYYAARGSKEAPVEPAPAFDKRAHFLDCIEHGEEPVADVRWGLKVMTVAEAIIESAASGKVVNICS